MNSFLRWAGSKRKLLPALLDAAPKKFGRYVEPFAGSACLFFALEPERALLSDINADLVNTYMVLRRRPRQLILTLASFRKGEQEYYRVRAQSSRGMGQVKRAARFIYLNRYCFNGLYRTNRLGGFNVPYGGLKAGDLPSSDVLLSCAESLRLARVSCCSFEQTLAEAQKNDFVYLDPPYAIKSRRVFNEYSHFGFGESELRSLRTQLLRLDGIGVRFLVSYGLSREAKDLARGFKTKEIVVQRQIAGFATSRRKSRELLIMNY
jgi:DNA adenine methylase